MLGKNTAFLQAFQRNKNVDFQSENYVEIASISPAFNKVIHRISVKIQFEMPNVPRSSLQETPNLSKI